MLPTGSGEDGAFGGPASPGMEGARPLRDRDAGGEGVGEDNDVTGEKLMSTGAAKGATGFRAAEGGEPAWGGRVPPLCWPARDDGGFRGKSGVECLKVRPNDQIGKN